MRGWYKKSKNKVEEDENHKDESQNRIVQLIIDEVPDYARP
jgi:hypothetical protein